MTGSQKRDGACTLWEFFCYQVTDFSELAARVTFCKMWSGKPWRRIAASRNFPPCSVGSPGNCVCTNSSYLYCWQRRCPGTPWTCYAVHGPRIHWSGLSFLQMLLCRRKQSLSTFQHLFTIPRAEWTHTMTKNLLWARPISQPFWNGVKTSRATSISRLVRKACYRISLSDWIYIRSSAKVDRNCHR